MKYNILIILFILCKQNCSAQAVYICTGGSATKYHTNKDCSGLKRCGGDVKTISMQEASAMGKTLCKRCSGKTTAKSSKTNQTSSVTRTKNIELASTAKGRQSQIIHHIGYTSSYSSSWLIPNWVAYDLTSAEVSGSFKRPNKSFEPDPLVKGRSAEHYDYTNSGYSRGHMAPAADMKWSEQAMLESFYLSNVCPQVAELNGGVWERLESRCRELANESTVYICCGPIVEKKYQTIGNNGVAVPAKFFKVLCMKRKGKWQAIGFIMPNASCKGSMFDYSMSVDDVEKLTGHNFFYNLPDDIEKSIESSFNRKHWM